MPYFTIFQSKKKYQDKIIDNLENIFDNILIKYNNLSSGDFPNVEQMKVHIDIYITSLF